MAEARQGRRCGGRGEARGFPRPRAAGGGWGGDLTISAFLFKMASPIARAPGEPRGTRPTKPAGKSRALGKELKRRYNTVGLGASV